MKFAKLGFNTLEGLSLAGYSDGWSMEYGEGGSYHCTLTYNGTPVVEIEDEGNGGPTMYNYLTKDKKLQKEVSDKVVAFLKRTNKDYGPDSMYDFCRDATEAGDCEFGTIVSDLTSINEQRKKAASVFKKGYKLFMVASTEGYGYTLSWSPRDDEKDLVTWYEKQKGVNKKRVYSFLREADLKKDI